MVPIEERCGMHDKQKQHVLDSAYAQLHATLESVLKEHGAFTGDGQLVPDTEAVFKPACTALLALYVATVSTMFGSEYAASEGLKMYGLALAGCIQTEVGKG
jgi:hypothetical protein